MRGNLLERRGDRACITARIAARITARIITTPRVHGGEQSAQRCPAALVAGEEDGAWMAGVHPRAAPQGGARGMAHPLVRRQDVWEVQGEVDAQDRGDAGCGAGAHEAHRAVDAIAIGEREHALTVLDCTRDERVWHRGAVAQRICRCHVKVGEVHGTRLTPLPAGTAAGRCATTRTPGRGRSRHRAAGRRLHAA